MHTGIIDILVAGLFGGLIGLLSGLVGIGGGVLIVPMLLFYYGLDIHTAVSTSILAITLIIASSFTYYAKLRRIRYKLGTFLELSTIPGAITGSYVGYLLSRELLEMLFASVLLASSIKLIHNSLVEDSKEKLNKPFKEISKIRLLFGALGSFFAGFVAGSVGISGGSLKTPLLILVLGVPEHVAVATSNYMMFLTTLSALITHMYIGHVDYSLGITLGVGGIIGAQIGGRINVKLNRKIVARVLGLILLLVSVRMLIDSLMIIFSYS